MQGRDPRIWPVSDARAIARFFQALHKHVIYFSGYGELGYEHANIVRDVALAVFSEHEPDNLIALTGTLLRVGGHGGIAEVYDVARELGIRTAGIHPSVARRFAETHRVSPSCDDVFFVEDESWGGYLTALGEPSPTLRVHLDVADELVAVGGGKHAADELRAFFLRGTGVRYFPADMNHATTRAWSRRAGADIRDFRGAAYDAWRALGGVT